MSQNSISKQPQNMKKKKKNRNPCGNPDPDAKVIELPVESMTSETRFVCETCNKEFQRNQALQSHQQTHDKLLRKLKQIQKKVYVCPEPSCEYHQHSKALTSISAIKKHYFRKHGEKRWKCEKCPKSYTVESDLRAHLKICELNQYKCECGTIFSRKHSLTVHKRLCKPLPEGSDRLLPSIHPNHLIPPPPQRPPSPILVLISSDPPPQNPSPSNLINTPHLSSTATASQACSTTDMDVTSTWEMDDLFTIFDGDQRPDVGGSGSGSGSGSEMNIEQGGGAEGSDSWSDMDDVDFSAIWDYLDN